MGLDSQWTVVVNMCFWLQFIAKYSVFNCIERTHPSFCAATTTDKKKTNSCLHSNISIEITWMNVFIIIGSRSQVFIKKNTHKNYHNFFLLYIHEIIKQSFQSFAFTDNNYFIYRFMVWKLFNPFFFPCRFLLLLLLLLFWKKKIQKLK